MPLFGSNEPLQVAQIGIGEVPDEHHEIVRGAIETHFFATVEVSWDLSLDTEAETPEGEKLSVREIAYEEERDQWDGGALLEWFGDPEYDTSVQVTGLDLFWSEQPLKSYVFGMAYIDGERLVVSTSRLSDGDWTSTATARLRKEAIKQFGRSLGAENCDDDLCLMSTTFTTEELDQQDEHFCEDCRSDIGESNLR